ncbi:MAG: ArsB/NhaD family transporter [Nitrospirae bacterium]|nr:ArsB/NhaD family transporter [Nitrospirota bacterium]
MTGMTALVVATAIFVATYIAIMTEKVNRAVIALLGAAIMVFFGIQSQAEAFKGIDLNTIFLLIGMMVIVAVTQQSGVFQYLAVWSAKRVGGRPWAILVALGVVTAVLSALLDNVTTVLLVAPVTLLIADVLRVSPYPYLFTQIFASNIGGTATLIGDPPNIMIGSAVGLSFVDFLVNLAPITVVIFAATLGPLYLIWGRKMRVEEEDRARLLEFDEREAIQDPVLLKKSLAVLAAVIVSFTAAHGLRLEPAIITLTGAVVLLWWSGRDFHQTFAEVEWVTIFFFVGLFMLVHGLENVGLLKILAGALATWSGGDLLLAGMLILWGSAILSAAVDNIPFVATMIPIIKGMAPAFGGEEAIRPLWWALALGACLGGNGTIIGASANLIVAGFAERAGQPIRFLPFMIRAFPLMLLSIAISSLYWWLRYV